MLSRNTFLRDHHHKVTCKKRLTCHRHRKKAIYHLRGATSFTRSLRHNCRSYSWSQTFKLKEMARKGDSNTLIKGRLEVFHKRFRDSKMKDQVANPQVFIKKRKPHDMFAREKSVQMRAHNLKFKVPPKRPSIAKEPVTQFINIIRAASKEHN